MYKKGKLGMTKFWLIFKLNIYKRLYLIKVTPLFNIC